MAAVSGCRADLGRGAGLRGWLGRVSGIGEDHDTGDEYRPGLHELFAQRSEVSADVGVVRGLYESFRSLFQVSGCLDVPAARRFPGELVSSYELAVQV